MAGIPSWLWIIPLFASSAIAGESRSEAASAVTVKANQVAMAAAMVARAYGTVTSIERSIAHNRAVRGVPNSYHLNGQAIDVVRKPGVSHRQLGAALEAAGFTLIESLDKGGHSHFAFAASTSPSKTLPSPAQVNRESADRGSPPIAHGRGRSSIEQPVLADQHGILLVDLSSLSN